MKLLMSWILGIATTGLVTAGLMEVGRNAVERAWREHPEQFLNEVDRAQAAELEQRRVAVYQRVMAKSAMAGAVARGELELLEAARCFRDLTTPDERTMYALRERFPNMSDDELFCRHVIGYVEAAPNREPGKTKELIARLREELRHRLKSGPICLDD